MYKELLGNEGGDMEIDKNALSILGGMDDFYAYVFLDLFIDHELHDK